MMNVAHPRSFSLLSECGCWTRGSGVSSRLRLGNFKTSDIWERQTSSWTTLLRDPFVEPCQSASELMLSYATTKSDAVTFSLRPTSVAK